MRFILALILTVVAHTAAYAQVTVPHTLADGETIDAARLNANFSVLSDALNRTGGTITGNIAVNGGVTIDGIDISVFLPQSVATTATPTFSTLTLSSTGASALDVGGGINAGTGNVALVAADGRITAISSTYFASVSGTSLTGVPVLLQANSGSTTSTSAENVDTIAITGLTAKDTLLVKVTWEAVTQASTSIALYNSTDSVTLVDINDQAGLGNFAAGREAIWDINARQLQSAATAVMSMSRGHNDANASYSTGANATFTTNWTGSWTLALRHGGVVAGGTGRWSWAVYKIQGQ